MSNVSQSSTTDAGKGTAFVHSVVIAEEPDMDGVYWVRCVPHGEIGRDQDRVTAFLMALEHDRQYGGKSA